jgi:hypothetical protein
MKLDMYQMCYDIMMFNIIRYYLMNIIILEEVNILELNYNKEDKT